MGTFIALTAGLSSSFITANLPQLQGEYGLTPVESAWLPAAYVMANVSSNLILFKARQQYGFYASLLKLVCLHVYRSDDPAYFRTKLSHGYFCTFYQWDGCSTIALWVCITSCRALPKNTV